MIGLSGKRQMTRVGLEPTTRRLVGHSASFRSGRLTSVPPGPIFKIGQEEVGKMVGRAETRIQGRPWHWACAPLAPGRRPAPGTKQRKPERALGLAGLSQESAGNCEQGEDKSLPEDAERQRPAAHGRRGRRCQPRE